MQWKYNTIYIYIKRKKEITRETKTMIVSRRVGEKTCEKIGHCAPRRLRNCFIIITLDRWSFICRMLLSFVSLITTIRLYFFLIIFFNFQSCLDKIVSVFEQHTRANGNEKKISIKPTLLLLRNTIFNYQTISSIDREKKKLNLNVNFVTTL